MKRKQVEAADAGLFVGAAGPVAPRNINMLAIVVCVWHPETDELLFDGASASVSVQNVRDIVGSSFPEDPEIMTAHPVPVMGKKFDGDGEF